MKKGDKDFKARTVTIRRYNGQYHLGHARNPNPDLIPAMCQEWETVTGMQLDEGLQVNVKLHIEVMSAPKPIKSPEEAVPQQETRAEAPLRQAEPVFRSTGAFVTNERTANARRRRNADDERRLRESDFRERYHREEDALVRRLRDEAMRYSSDPAEQERHFHALLQRERERAYVEQQRARNYDQQRREVFLNQSPLGAPAAAAAQDVDETVVVHTIRTTQWLETYNSLNERQREDLERHVEHLMRNMAEERYREAAQTVRAQEMRHRDPGHAFFTGDIT